jgi:DNA polymerase-3 subunit delta'
MSVWDDLVGQGAAVAVLRRAVAGEGHSMTHAWLITGPPGSGRSNAATAFAAALQCEAGGCGECRSCRTSLSGAHPDVTLVRTEKLSIGVDDVRRLVTRAAMSPSVGRRQVIVVEDADRVTERGAPALLKAVEEPAPRTVWVLCAPTPDDVLATIRSRCRHVSLVTPSDEAVAQLLIKRDKVEPAMAHFVARVAQGHIGRARNLARDEQARSRRHEVLRLPAELTTLGACLRAADNLVKSAADEAASRTAGLDEREKAELSQALGFGTTGARPRNTQAALKDLDDQQKLRAKRLQRDALDRVLTELTVYYRDVLAVQLGTGAPLINAELATPIAAVARRTTPEATIRRIDAILETRTALEGNVAPLLAMESLMIALGEGVLA